MAEPKIHILSEIDWFECFSISFHAVKKENIQKTLSNPYRKHAEGELATDESATHNFELWEVKKNPSREVKNKKQKSKNTVEIDNRAQRYLREYSINPESESGKAWRLQFRAADRNQRLAMMDTLKRESIKKGIFSSRINDLANRALLFDILHKLLWLDIPVTTNEYYWEGE